MQAFSEYAHYQRPGRMNVQSGVYQSLCPQVNISEVREDECLKEGTLLLYELSFSHLRETTSEVKQCENLFRSNMHEIRNGGINMIQHRLYLP